MIASSIVLFSSSPLAGRPPARRSLARGVGVVASVIATFLSGGEAMAQECPDGYPYDCGDGSCCPVDYPYCCGGGQCGADASCGGGSCPDGYPYDCGDGSCCPDSAPYCCGNGQCGSDASCGGSSTECPAEAPYLCDDGYCYATSDCGGGSCPSEAPYLCDDGLCYATADCGGPVCPSEAPVLCSDGLCYRSSDCSACPAGYPYDCGNGYCGDTPEACDGVNGSTAPGHEGTSPEAGTPGATPGGPGDEYCETLGVTYDGCESVQACCTASQCRYLTDDGSSFSCNGADCYAAAEETIAYCDDQAGCSTAPGPARGGPAGLAAVVALGLAAAARTRRRGARGAHRLEP